MNIPVQVRVEVHVHQGFSHNVLGVSSWTARSQVVVDQPRLVCQRSRVAPYELVRLIIFKSRRLFVVSTNLRKASPFRLVGEIRELELDNSLSIPIASIGYDNLEVKMRRVNSKPSVYYLIKGSRNNVGRENPRRKGRNFEDAYALHISVLGSYEHITALSCQGRELEQRRGSFRVYLEDSSICWSYRVEIENTQGIFSYSNPLIAAALKSGALSDNIVKRAIASVEGVNVWRLQVGGVVESQYHRLSERIYQKVNYFPHCS